MLRLAWEHEVVGRRRGEQLRRGNPPHSKNDARLAQHLFERKVNSPSLCSRFKGAPGGEKVYGDHVLDREWRREHELNENSLQ